MPDFGCQLTPEQEEKEIIKFNKRAPKYTEMVKEYVMMDEIFHKGIISMTDKLIDQLEDHKKAKQLYPRNSGGLYILLEGATCVRNSYNAEYDRMDPDDSKLSEIGFKFKPDPALLDVFGIERYLQV